jgi:DNA polymerase III delta prime subunit
MVWNNLLGYDNLFRNASLLFMRNKFPAVVLLKGRESLGKKTFAKKISSIFFCKNNSGCGNCSECNLIITNKHPYVINFDCSNIHFDKNNVRMVQEHLSIYASSEVLCKARVIVLGDIDNLSINIVNKLLKTFESTEKNCYIILTTSRAKLILPTLLSRSIEWHIKPPAEKELIKYFSKHKTVLEYKLSEKTITRIVKEQGLCPGNINSYLDSYCGDDLRLRDKVYNTLLSSNDNHRIFEIIEEINKKKDLSIHEIMRNLELEINKTYHEALEKNNFSQLDYSYLYKRRQVLQTIKRSDPFLKISFNKRLLFANVALKR